MNGIPFELRALDHLVLRVRDEARMLDFYTRVLGCREERRLDDLGLVQLRAGSSLIDFVRLDGPLGRRGGAAPGREGRNLEHFCLRIEPFNASALAAHLEANGLPPAAVETRYGAEGFGPSLYLTDPEGNTVELKGPPPRNPSHEPGSERP
jgi:catechol 2,3-dioxygenase-like lactoylglutathione lyase family enzyme